MSESQNVESNEVEQSGDGESTTFADALANFASADDVVGDDAGDSVQDVAEVESTDTGDAAETTTQEEKPSELSEILAILKGGKGGAGESAAASKTETENKANQSADATPDELDALLAEHYGDDSSKWAKAMDARVEKRVTAELDRFANLLKPYLDVVRSVKMERQAREDEDIADNLLAEMMGKDSGLGEFYGKARSGANADQVAIRKDFKEALSSLVASGVYDKMPNGREKLLRHAHSIALEEYRLRQGSKQQPANKAKKASVEIVRNPAKLQPKQASDKPRVGRAGFDKLLRDFAERE